MKRVGIFFIALILISCTKVFIKEPHVEVKGDGIYETVLENGLKVIAIKDSGAPVAVFQVWYDAGSINDPLGKSGLSHLLEHMMFKGTHKYGPKTFSRMIKRVGGIDNAGTSKDFAYYYEKLPPESLEIAIELEADRMQNLIIDPEETESERSVVMEERRMRYEDDPQALVYEELLATAFRNHPYKRPVIGWMEDLETINRDDLWRYYRQRYVPENAFVVVGGDIDVERIFNKIREEFGRIPGGDAPPEINIKEPPQRGERRFYIKKEAELPYILIGYKVPNIFSEDAYALEVLATILSGGRSARLYRSLVDEKKIALSADAGYNSLYRYPSLFLLDGTPMPGHTAEELERALYEEIEKIKKTPPSLKEVQKAKNQIEADFIMNQDSMFYRAMIIAEFELLGDWHMKDRYLDGIRKVTPEDVQRVARKYFVDETKTVGILIPTKNATSTS